MLRQYVLETPTGGMQRYFRVNKQLILLEDSEGTTSRNQMYELQHAIRSNGNGKEEQISLDDIAEGDQLVVTVSSITDPENTSLLGTITFISDCPQMDRYVSET